MIRVIVSVFLQMDHADTEQAVMMEEYSEFHSESLNEDVLLSQPLAEGGRTAAPALCGPVPPS